MCSQRERTRGGWGRVEGDNERESARETGEGERGRERNETAKRGNEAVREATRKEQCLRKRGGAEQGGREI